MSTAPQAATSIPFEPTTTPTIEKANRLMSLRAHPGFLDLLRISQELVQEAGDTSADYGGWDKDQIVILKVRHQTAKEYHRMLLVKLNQAIEAGVEEARTTKQPEKTASEILDQGDLVRQKVLERFDEKDDLRIPGSY